MFCVIVSGANLVAFGMGELPLNHVRRKAMFIENGAGRSAKAVSGCLETIIGNRLDEDCAAVMSWRGGHVNLQRETAIFLKHLVVNVLNGHEPRHAAVVDVAVKIRRRLRLTNQAL